MKTKIILIALISIVYISCNQNSKPVQEDSKEDKHKKTDVQLKDYGPEPTALDIDSYTVENTNFRTVLWTGENLQVTLMSIPVGGDVGLEMHPDIDQFLRIEKGKGQVLMGNDKDKLTFKKEVEDDFAIMVPAGKWHNIVNTGDEPLKLYSIYAPAEHPHGTIHKTQQESIDAEHHH